MSHIRITEGRELETIRVALADAVAIMRELGDWEAQQGYYDAPVWGRRRRFISEYDKLPQRGQRR